MQKQMNKYYRQRGVVLMVSIIMMVVIAMLTLSLLTMSRVGMRMANNEEARANALQMAQAINENIISDPDMTPVIGAAGFRLCTSNVGDCDMETIVPTHTEISTAVDLDQLSAVATRGTPEFQPPPRGMGFSVAKFASTSFELDAVYDRADEGQGFAEVREGLIVMIPL
jgi:hypothetical protein